jgi:geranylgeranyl reductase family protein
MDYDVIVVGGGPVGLITARDMARNGLEVCILEEHQEIGYPVQCSGLFSVSGLKALDLDLDDTIIANTIKGGRFYSPSGRELTAYSDKERARVVERKLFDKYLAREAARAGADIRVKTSARGVKRDKGGMKVSVESFGKRETITSSLLLGADGVRSRVARWYGLETPKKMVAAAQVEVAEADVEDDIAEMYFGREYAPDFYGWVLSKGSTVEVGVGVRRGEMGPRAYLKRFLEEHPVITSKVKPTKIIEFNMGGIPVEGAPRTVSDRLMLVGDAAGQTKASTGGGVITGSICGRIAAEAAVKAVAEGEFSEEFLGLEYEEKWRAGIGRELEVHRVLRDILDALSDAQMEKLFQAATETGLGEAMTKYTDTDHVSRFFGELMGNDKMVSVIQEVLGTDPFSVPGSR